MVVDTLFRVNDFYGCCLSVCSSPIDAADAYTSVSASF